MLRYKTKFKITFRAFVRIFCRRCLVSPLIIKYVKFDGCVDEQLSVWRVGYMTFSNYFSSVSTEASDVSTSYPGSFLRSLLSTRLTRCLAHGVKHSPRCWHRMADRLQIKKRRWRDERDSLRNSPYLVFLLEKYCALDRSTSGNFPIISNVQP